MDYIWIFICEPQWQHHPVQAPFPLHLKALNAIGLAGCLYMSGMLGTGIPWLFCCSQFYVFQPTASIHFVSRVKKILAFNDNNNHNN